jgi:hypothetical protein
MSPLLHFLALGVALFVLFSLVGSRSVSIGMEL